jgi:SAM-dependent methyltransferase
MDKQCLVCGKQLFHPIYNNTLLKCGSCGFITANMSVDPELLRKTYTENYFKGEEYVDYLRDKAILQTNFRKRLKTIYRIIGKEKISKAVEIGCAYGFFAELLTNDNKKISYTGFDVVPEAIEYGRVELKQNLVCGDYLKEKSEADKTDVFMWDVIEHLPNPEDFITKAASELQSGGRIYITTGDIGKLIPRIRKEKWRMIHPPSHLQYFSRSTLTQLLESRGFKVIHVSYPPVYRSARLIWYSLFMLRKKYPKLVSMMYNMIPAKLNFPINTFDIMFVIAVKK